MQVMLTAGEALTIIRRTVRPLPATRQPLESCLGRVLTDAVVADRDVPGFDNSSMDGFAVPSVPAGPTSGQQLQVIGEAAAGRPYPGRLRPGEAVRIMTGAPIPAGAESVIELEQVRESNGSISFELRPAQGRNVRRAGEDLRRGALVVSKGTRLRPAHLGVLASLGKAEVSVSPAPRVSVVTTGSELVDPRGTLETGQIHNSSGVLVPAMLREAGAVIDRTLTVHDEPAAMRSAFDEALTSDLLITTGGVSVGKHDLVMQTLREAGVEFLFWKVKIKPGMPIAFGRSPRGTPVVCLPGNPVSTGVTFQQFVRPILDALEGSEGPVSRRWTARLEHPVEKTDEKRHYSRGIATFGLKGWTVKTTGPQSSGVLSSLLQANCLLIIPESVSRLAADADVEIEWL